jgi:hypothetical protein
VNITIAATPGFKAGFIATVAKTIGVSSSAVIITSIIAIQSSRRSLLATSVQISYNVISSSTYNQIGQAVNSAISSGTFSNDLQSNTGTTVTAATTAAVTDVTPTSMPTLMPITITESVSRLMLGRTPIIIIAVIGFVVVLSILFMIYWCYQTKKPMFN